MRSEDTHYVNVMLKRLFSRTEPVSQTIPRPARVNQSSRWAAVMPPLGRRVRVCRIERETAAAVTVSIEPVDGGVLGFAAGQYLTHCFEVDGQVLRRAYSLSVPEGSAVLAYTCKAVAGGQVSQHVCEQLAVGDEYEVRGPSGEFRLAPGHDPLVFVAAGSGITPVISLLETALQTDPERSICLVYANRCQADIIFAQRLAGLEQRFAQLRVIHVLTRAEADWTGERGRLNGHRVLELARPAQHSQFYVCGPAALMDVINGDLQQAGVDAESIHREDFRSVNHAAVEHPKAVQTINFLKTGRAVAQQPGQSILDAALAQGVELSFSCTVGGCAACKIKVVQGRTALDEPNCLSPDEREQGFVLACSAYALEPIEVEA